MILNFKKPSEISKINLFKVVTVSENYVMYIEIIFIELCFDIYTPFTINWKNFFPDPLKPIWKNLQVSSSHYIISHQQAGRILIELL